MSPLMTKAIDLILPKNVSQAPVIAHLSYRSKALQVFNDDQLGELELAASTNNKKLGVTGIFLYNNGDFFQSIEGPPDKLESTWAKILADDRHSITEIQPLSYSPYRLYSGWNMKLFKQKNIYKSSIDSYSPQNRTSDLLFNLVREDIWPALLKNHELNQAPTVRDTYEIHRLAKLLITDQSDLPEQMLQAYFQKNNQSLGNFYSFVIGPLALYLGDLSSEDLFNEFEVTIALNRALVFFRKIRHIHSGSFISNSPKVTVANMPGEQHIISSVIDYEILWQAGMDVTLNFSKTDEQLLSYVHTNKIDVLDLSQSPTLFKASQLARLKMLIGHIYDYSLNPKIAIILKGRGFSNLSKNHESFGADLICNVTNELKKNVLDVFNQSLTVPKPIQILKKLKTIIH
ncbi:BLUF domain-containing protein [Polynucleobacter rarus]|uniref:BLUF domain-containing protein n=1 Tax=Polynucleobacter rarus TaxID=556055 RepID=UPI00131EFE20|nr:BLUF domain-containing protein [Polynucleobacter rarus]